MMAEAVSEYILAVSNLKKYYREEKRLSFSSTAAGATYLRAVDDVSFSMGPNEVLGLVGESGCGKSTLGKTLIRLEEPTSGRIQFEGRDITRLSQEDLRALRRKMQIVFQDPASSLNPRKTVFQIISQPLRVHGLARSKSEALDRVADILDRVGLEREHLARYPHQFSGGQRQRICIARAISLGPSFLVADEVVSALDVSVQAQILNLLLTLKQEMALAILFISHDLSVVRQVSDRVAVMYLGKIVELAPSEDLFSHPLHPYTQALMSAIPVPDADVDWMPTLLKGETPSPTQRPPGCAFHPRCPLALEPCSTQAVVLEETDPGHFAACHLLQGL